MNRALEALMQMNDEQRQTLQLHFQCQILLLNLDVMDLYHHPMNSLHVEEACASKNHTVVVDMPTTTTMVRVKKSCVPNAATTSGGIRKQKITKKKSPKRIVFHEYKVQSIKI